MTKTNKPRLLRSLAAYLIIAALLCSLVPFGALADDDDDFQTTLAELNARKEEASAARQDAEEKVKELEGIQEELIAEKIALEERNEAVAAEISLIEQTIALYDTRIERKQLQLDIAEEHVNEQLELYQNRVRAMEERGTYSVFDLIFNAQSFAQLISSIDDYREIMENDRLVYDNLRQARTEHEEMLNEFISVREESEAAKAELEAEMESLLEQIGASKESIDELTAAIAEAEEQVLAAARAEAAAGAAAAEFVRQYLEQKAAEEAARREEEERREQENSGGSGDNISGGININDFIGNGDTGEGGSTGGDNGGSTGSGDNGGSSDNGNSGSDNTGSGDNSGDSSYEENPGSTGGNDGGSSGGDGGDSSYDDNPGNTGNDNTGSGDNSGDDYTDFPSDNGGDNSGSGDNSGDSSYEENPGSTGGNDGGNGGNGGSNGGGNGGNGGSSGGSTGGAGTANGYFVWPFPGHYCITSTFGYRESTKTNHTGIDIDGYQSMGSPIVAADGGVVIMSQYYGGYGNCIMIDHGNGLITLYSHMSGNYVSVGDKVSQGQTIAGVGNTGTVYGTDGIHLHFEVYSGGAQVNPLGYLGGYPYYFYNN